MNRNWRALHRVGERLGLEGDQLDDYLSIVSDVHDEKMETDSGNYELKEEYFTFLNKEVFSDERVVKVLSELGVSDSELSEFEDASIDVPGMFRTQWRVKHRFDELVDTIMLISLVKQYREWTGENSVRLDKLQYLAYLTNDEISELDDDSVKPEKTNMGMLERTGYRYSFVKRGSRAESSELLKDKDRMVASSIFDEEVDSESDPNHIHPYSIEFGKSGQAITKVYGTKLTELVESESVLLSVWANCQIEVVRKWGDSSIDTLESEIHQRSEFEEKNNGSTLLVGRSKVFRENDGPVLAGFMEAVA